ncbi:aminotransferase class IV family protein [Achromobacter sp.]|uniref:aminotransferase class IV family protein n=1 Tax=Achromobacter sp. TaxID=134375 RepID=UPI0028AE5E3C|nr:aminotransferase class IV family protein [Achromobacter sp.]
MSTSPASFVVQRNGQPATAEDLAPLAFAGYAHFTAMQVRNGRARGLDLHLTRLKAASIEMFGQALPDEAIRDYLRTAIQASPDDHSLVATVYSPAGEFTVAGPDARPEVLVRTGPPASGPGGPLALAAVEHERMLPQVKHVGEVAKTYYLRQAAAQGFDDAAFVDRNGRLSEASIWNLAFWDGTGVIWPDAAMLRGTTMGIVQRQLERLGVPQRTRAVALADLPGLRGAAVMNSWTPGVAVSRIGETAFPEAPAFLEALHRAYGVEAPAAP